MMKSEAYILASILLLSWLPTNVFAEEKEHSTQEIINENSSTPTNLHLQLGQIVAPPLRMIQKGIYELGGVRIIKKENQIEFPATVNMNKGLLEYLLVGRGGKVHESLLVTNVEPYSLQIALLMLGFEGTINPITRQGDTKTPEGDPVNVSVLWEQKGQDMQMQIEDWIDIKTKKLSGKVKWVFTGSVISDDGVFMAQLDQSIIAVYHDPFAMIDNTLPEGANDEIWLVNEERTPPVGTPVTIILKKIQ